MLPPSGVRVSKLTSMIFEALKADWKVMEFSERDETLTVSLKNNVNCPSSRSMLKLSRTGGMLSSSNVAAAIASVLGMSTTGLPAMSNTIGSTNAMLVDVLLTATPVLRFRLLRSNRDNLTSILVLFSSETDPTDSLTLGTATSDNP